MYTHVGSLSPKESPTEIRMEKPTHRAALLYLGEPFTTGDLQETFPLRPMLFLVAVGLRRI